MASYYPPDSVKAWRCLENRGLTQADLAKGFTFVDGGGVINFYCKATIETNICFQES